MSNSFLARLLSVAHQVTQAERGFAVNNDLKVLEKFNVDDSVLEEQSFRDFAHTWLTRALDDGKTIITNNIITDPSKAPNTNTNFANLRVVVCIPVKAHGAIYLDQHIRNGIIPRDVIDRFSDMIYSIQKNRQEDISEEHMLAMFEKMS
jgi:hypothetical protein